MADSKRVTIVVALIGAAATIVAALITVAANRADTPSPGPGDTDVVTPSLPGPPEPASAFLSRDSGPGGSRVQVSGEGFAAGERVVIRFHVEQIGSTTANGQGRFTNVTVTIPRSMSEFAPQQFFVIAQGQTSIRSAQAPFTITG